EVLAMVSRPGFNPNEASLEENWSQLIEAENAPFVARATQGLYPPGSTFKTIIAASAIESGLGNTIFEDKGSVTIDGRPINNYGGKAYGNIDLMQALTHSSNVAFAEMGVNLGEDRLKKIADYFYFNKKINLGIDVMNSSFPNNNMKKTDMAEMGIGQG